MTYLPEHHPAAAYYAAPDGTAAERPHDLTALAVVAFSTAAVATVGTSVAALVLGRAMRVRAEGSDAVDWSLGLYYAGTGIAILALVAGFVAGSLWLHRARRNAELLEPGSHHARRSGWAWGGWVTPVVALWYPFQVVRDVRRAVVPAPSAALIGFWWSLFLASEIGWRTSLNLQGDALNRLGDPATAHAASVITAAVMVAALAGWGEVLRTVTSEQHARMYRPSA